MKRIILLATLVSAFFVIGFAQQHQIARVSSDGTTTLYTDLKTVMSEAQNDDFIYLPGKIYTVDSLVFKKRVNVIGTGFYPDSTKASGKTVINSTVYRLEGSADGSLQGVEINGNIMIGGTGNFTISKCMFKQIKEIDADAKGTISVKECVVKEYFLNSMANSGNLIYNASNCIIYDITSCHFAIFTNCVFTHLGYFDYWSGGCLINCSDIELKNCILSIYRAGSSNQNNRSYNSHIESATGNNISTFCTDVNTTFDDVVNSTFEGGPCPTDFSYDFDFHVKSTSKAISNGTDDTQKGIYGSNTPYDPNPYNPHIYYRNIATSTNAQGQLQVTIKVQAH